MVFIKASILLIGVLTVVTCRHHAPGYSYAKFSGPVSGPEKEIIVQHEDKHGHSHGHTVDYVAKPDYHFAYGVEDPKSKVSQSRKETRHGDTVHGEYSVVDPDGVLRVVKYTADKHNGFQAEVITSKGHGGGGDGGGHGDGGDGGHDGGHDGGYGGHYESVPAHQESHVEHGGYEEGDDSEEY